MVHPICTRREEIDDEDYHCANRTADTRRQDKKTLNERHRVWRGVGGGVTLPSLAMNDSHNDAIAFDLNSNSGNVACLAGRVAAAARA